MLAPRSAKAKHLSIPKKSHEMRNLAGFPSFSGNFWRRTAEQCSFSGVLANSNNLSLLVNKLLMVEPNLGMRMRASAKLMLKFKSWKIWKNFSIWLLAFSQSLWLLSLDRYGIDGFGLGFGVLTEASTGSTTGATTGSEFGGTVSFVTSGSRSNTLGEEEVVGIVGPLYAIQLRVVIHFKSSFGIVMV
uniref:Uncharacterized protein n=1 Tax=Tanacetum cinerariifolium TaxID=118510 RepID=A0A6L2M1G6_TANCI|nr:hypothetical protein [Tanacetum cinerariifolium]